MSSHLVSPPLLLRRASCCAWFFEKPVYFVIIGIEWVAHNEEVAAVARDRIPVDHIGKVALLEKANGACTTGCAGVRRSDMGRARTADTVVPFRNSFARCHAEEQSAARIDIVVFQIDALQPGIVPA